MTAPVLSRALALRWLKFSSIGALGAVVQFGVLAVLVSGLRLNYLIATAIAVEVAVLHNFVWHERYTWKDRPSTSRLALAVRLLRFNVTAGLLSIAGNIALMLLFTGVLRLNYLLANAIAIVILSLANFTVSHTFVFRTGARIL